MNETLDIIFQHPVATFFILFALAEVVNAANPFKKEITLIKDDEKTNDLDKRIKELENNKD